MGRELTDNERAILAAYEEAMAPPAPGECKEKVVSIPSEPIDPKAAWGGARPGPAYVPEGTAVAAGTLAIYREAHYKAMKLALGEFFAQARLWLRYRWRGLWGDNRV
jgi:hypothetical protein